MGAAALLVVEIRCAIQKCEQHTYTSAMKWFTRRRGKLDQPVELTPDDAPVGGARYESIRLGCNSCHDG
jgi:hypothetical protein